MIVLLAVFEKQVISEAFATSPISGRHAIFARVQAPTEMKLDCEIVGVFSNLDMCNAAREVYAREHPGRRYLQKVCRLDNAPTVLPEAHCLGCGMVLNDGRSFCPPCSDAHNKAARELDPRGGEGDLVPLVRTSHGPESVIRNTG